MATERDFDRQLRLAFREVLDRELGPDPLWTESPAARRIAELGRRRRFGSRPVRLLAVAAILAVGGGAAILAGRPIRPPVQLGPNGWIAYTVDQLDSRGEVQDSDIYLVGLNAPPRRIIGTDSDGLDQICPAFAPDGARLAYGEAENTGQVPSTRGDPGFGFPSVPGYQNPALVLGDVAADGHFSPSQRINVGGHFPPPCAVWSPDGARIAFAAPLTPQHWPAQAASGSAVWIVRLSDRQITIVPNMLATDLEWSPDGSDLAIASGNDAIEPRLADLTDGLIYLYSIQTGDLRALLTTRGVTTLTWAPDGRRVAYETGDEFEVTKNASDAAQLRVVDVNTGRDQTLATGLRVLHGIGPVWSPLGDRIVYQRSPDGEEGHDVILVTSGDAPNEGATPTSDVFSTPRTGRGLEGRSGFWAPWRVTWSPDGQYLLCVAWDQEITGGLVAVPVDPHLPAAVLAHNPRQIGETVPAGDYVSAYDGYPYAFVPIQTWGRQPSR